ncbi:MAG: hypothetical protein LBK66_07280 [Spirochaetaceae bacterium]|jgi:hypothetical protein|nr:hypothetical protein [Spirochaetaceae bacterium]
MKGESQKIGNLPFELTQVSASARKHLKILAASLLQYHKDLSSREPEVFPPERGKNGGQE